MEDSEANTQQLRQEIETLREELEQTQNRLRIAEETLQAIQSGEVDALVITTNEGDQVFTLQRSDHVYQSLVEQMAEGAATITSDGLILYANQRLAELLNCPLSKLIGSTLDAFIAPSNRKAFQLLLQQIAITETVTQELSLVPATTNRLINVKLSLRKLVIENEILNSIVITDITAYKRQEEAKLEKILESAIAAIISYKVFSDHSWEYLYWSPGCEQIFGYTSEELIHDPNLWISQIVGEDLETVKDQLFNFRKNQEINHLEYRFRHQDQSLRWIASAYFAQWDQTNNYWLGTAVFTDITQRKQAEQKIAEQAALIDITSDAITVRDLDNKIIFWNQGATRLYGWQNEEVIGKDVNDFLYPKSSYILEQPIKKTLATGSWQGELEQVTKAGKSIIVASRWNLIYDELKQPHSILVVSSDITEKKQLEKQFYQMQRLESVGTLASGIAHDLNNIFTPILGITQILPLKLPNLDERTKHLLDIIESSVNRGINLVKQILTFARGTEEKYGTVYLKYLIKEILNITKQTLPKSINISLDLEPNSSLVARGDATQIHQVLLNLVINARDAMPNGGIITISAENKYLDPLYGRMNLNSIIGNFQEGNYVVITVCDTGLGMPPEVLEHIFEPFFTTKEVGKGTGLGLSTVLGIVRNHEGFLQVFSEFNQGTQFKIYLPAIIEEARSQVKPTAELLRGDGELILIVDDESSIREITEVSLQDYNYQTMVASNGMEAIAIYVQHSQEIRVVLMDIMMPYLNGLVAIRTLKQINPNLLIIANSGLNEQREAALEAGASAFIPKPYTIEDLCQNLADLLQT